jgi:hypothetical protein
VANQRAVAGNSHLSSDSSISSSSSSSVSKKQAAANSSPKAEKAKHNQATVASQADTDATNSLEEQRVKVTAAPSVVATAAATTAASVPLRDGKSLFYSFSFSFCKRLFKIE